MSKGVGGGAGGGGRWGENRDTSGDREYTKHKLKTNCPSEMIKWKPPVLNLYCTRLSPKCLKATPLDTHKPQSKADLFLSSHPQDLWLGHIRGRLLNSTPSVNSRFHGVHVYSNLPLPVSHSWRCPPHHTFRPGMVSCTRTQTWSGSWWDTQVGHDPSPDCDQPVNSWRVSPLRCLVHWPYKTLTGHGSVQNRHTPLGAGGKLHTAEEQSQICTHCFLTWLKLWLSINSCCRTSSPKCFFFNDWFFKPKLKERSNEAEISQLLALCIDVLFCI